MLYLIVPLPRFYFPRVETTPSRTRYDCNSEGREMAAGRASFALGGRYQAPSGFGPVRGSRHASHLNRFFCPDMRREVELLRTTIQCSGQHVGSCLEIYQNR
ncbi:hypothetical protein PILCRDRAFT_824770, partial [Piloderma croceum F 1598]